MALAVLLVELLAEPASALREAGVEKLSDVAARAGVDPLLLERVDQGRQPMPFFLARRLAAVLGVPWTRVLGACPLVTPLAGAALLVPAPPRQGDPVRPRLPGAAPQAQVDRFSNAFLPVQESRR